ncbi:keratin 98 [Carassius auratus]|uniref:Keratin 98 n=1 Tax=Carassius auratus TaxID=7957 RepID=A0A6P6KZF5_CARAU|nr:keratin, type I cytoskeletal 13-like [Carassius auratus]
MSSRNTGVYGGGGFNLADGLDPSADEKTIMQNLNSRLASYLEKVRSLENANTELEQKIREHIQSRPDVDVTFKQTIFQDTIQDLRNKIHLASQDNGALLLSVDNARLAADDFKKKYEKELEMRMSIEADILKLRKVLDEFSLSRSDLEIKIENLNEELIILSRYHEEEMSVTRAEAVGHVDVSVDAAPSMDLMKAMTEIRQHYETVTEKKRQELETWYETKTAPVEQEVVTQNEELHNSRIELKELTNTLQKLQIELQTQQSLKSALDGELEETQARYGDQLARLQATVTSLEDQLSQFHNNIASNKREYETLLDVKNRLEHEIAEYKRLLDGNERESDKDVTKTITVMESTVDEKTVDSSESSGSVDDDEQND